jgi:hypothetical protein
MLLEEEEDFWPADKKAHRNYRKILERFSASTLPVVA